MLDEEAVRNLPLQHRHLAAAAVAAAAGNSTNVTGEQLYSNLYSKELGMMRKMVGVDEEKQYPAIPPGFQRQIMPNHHSHLPQQHTNIPPNMIQENMIYNPKFHSLTGHPTHNFGFPPINSNDSSHLHKMEGLLKPCYDPTETTTHFPNYNNHFPSMTNNNNNTGNNPHVPHQAQQQHYPNSNNNTSLVESPHFVNNNFPSNGNNNPKNNVNNSNNNQQQQQEIMHNNNNGGILVKQENIGINHDDFNNGPSSDNLFLNGNKKCIKNEPNDYNNLNFNSSGPKTKLNNNENITDLHTDDSIDKLSGLHDNDSNQ